MTAPTNWKTNRDKKRRQAPPPVVSACEVRESSARRSVRIRGARLFPFSMVEILVGGVRAESLTFAPDGTAIRGMLPDSPRSRTLRVDLGLGPVAIRARGWTAPR